MGDATGVALAVAVGVAEGVTLTVAVGEAEGVALGAPVGVAVGLALGVAEGVAVALGVPVGVAVAIGVGVGAGVTPSAPAAFETDKAIASERPPSDFRPLLVAERNACFANVMQKEVFDKDILEPPQKRYTVRGWAGKRM